MMVARCVSLRAPATISEADALPLLTRTTTGRLVSVASPSPVDSQRFFSPPDDSCVKIRPEPMNSDAIFWAASM